MSASLNIGIVGGGIGGLTAAIALQAGFALYILGFNFYTASQGWYGRGPGGPA